jgi:hypothetical protein
VLSRFILYGSILSSIVQHHKNDKNSKDRLPNFKNILEVKHFLPGRLRLYSPKIKNREDIKEMLISQLMKIQYINYVEFNTITGSVLIKYDKEKLDAVIIIAVIVKLLNLEKEIEKKPKSIIKKEIVNIKDSLNRAIYEKTNGIVDLETIILSLLLISGIYRVKTRPDVMPGGITLLWWANSNLR